MNRRLRRDAQAALDAMLAGDHDATDRALDRLATRHGPTGIPIALMHWCDAALARIPPGAGPVRLHWKDYDTGKSSTNPGAARTAEQWAGRLLAARAAGDLAAFTALARSVPAPRVGEHVGAMVQMAARIIQEANP